MTAVTQVGQREVTRTDVLVFNCRLSLLQYSRKLDTPATAIPGPRAGSCCHPGQGPRST